MEQIGTPEGHKLEYKAVLPPPKALAKLIASFANADGGQIILGVTKKNGKPESVGISREFKVSTILSRAVGFLTPPPTLKKRYIKTDGKNIIVIGVEKSNNVISTVEGEIYTRNGKEIYLKSSSKSESPKSPLLKPLMQNLSIKNIGGTQALAEFNNHLRSVIDIIDSVFETYFISDVEVPAHSQNGKVLTRLVFSSIADNFEVYMSNILYEIYLSKPETLKSEENVTVREILSCQDLQEFVEYWARKKIGKLQKGSVKGFIEENKQIKHLKVLTNSDVNELEMILQIRHVFIHSNGVVDEKFVRYFSSYSINDVFELSLKEMFAYISKLVNNVNKIDLASKLKFDLGEV
ncbi:putative DNA-binding protein [Neolewinella xylanilytica]|uniref:Putative DNA-binding protein n=1 Tax=Neolewinella xylanilytica TaxID=1514080 RepID=A0A2S6I8N8_9BACT|nr:ATP-binding protein [Neolewinella xylanilytica]PPK87866.1 putative DNA-binding protein [Neolewinella xylanilytica]